MSDLPESPRSAGGAPHFLTTHWSVVLRAGDSQSPDAAAALEKLCRAYWYPLYAFVRRQGHPPADAQDLTQEFFARLLVKEYLRGVEPEKGRFRTFLRMALKRFLANEWDRVRARKRGGDRYHTVFDTTAAEERFQLEPALAQPSEHIYDRRWALTLLDTALGRLESDYRDSGRLSEWQQLKPYLTAEHGAIPYPELAAAMRTSPVAARTAVHRLRKRFRELFRQTIADTVSTPEEVDAELGYVLEVLSRA